MAPSCHGILFFCVGFGNEAFEMAWDRVVPTGICTKVSSLLLPFVLPVYFLVLSMGDPAFLSFLLHMDIKVARELKQDSSIRPGYINYLDKADGWLVLGVWSHAKLSNYWSIRFPIYMCKGLPGD